MQSPHVSDLHALTSLFAVIPAATAISRLSDGKFVAANEAFLRLHGYALDEVVGRTSAELKLWAEPEARQRLMAILEREGKVDAFPVRWRNKSGATGDALVSVRVIDVDGEPHMAGFITEARLLDEQRRNLVAADNLYSSLFEHIPIAIAVCRMHYEQGVATDWTYLKVNPAFEKMSGLPNVVGCRMNELLPGTRDAYPEVYEIYGRVAMGHGPETFDIYSNRLEIWSEVTVFSIQAEHFVLVFKDISERRRLEQELRVNAERMEQVLSAVKLGTWDTDWETGHVLLDQHWCEILGCAPEELPSTKEALAQLIHPDDKVRVLAAMREHELGNARLYQCDYRLRHKEGHWVWVTSRGQIVARDEQGKALRVMGTVRDISEDRRLAQEGSDVLRQIEAMVQHLMGPRDARIGASPSPALPGPEKLSRRQRQILILIAQGKTSAEIGKQLKVATATVISHRRRLMSLLQVHSAAELTRYAIKHRLVAE